MSDAKGREGAPQTLPLSLPHSFVCGNESKLVHGAVQMAIFYDIPTSREAFDSSAFVLGISILQLYKHIRKIYF